MRKKSEYVECYSIISRLRCWEVFKTLDGIVYDAMRSMTQPSVSLATSREADSAGGNQTTGTLVERQVHRK
jgi:hypothetical protein